MGYSNEPVEGAIEYAREITEGMSREEAAELIANLRKQTSEDPRVKLCAVCGFPFRDKTRPCNALVCGPTCKITRKTDQRAAQRRKKPAVKPPKKPKKYDEQSFMMRVWRKETPYSTDKLERINAAKERYERMGGRKKPIREVEY